jgi:hypothetical protein
VINKFRRVGGNIKFLLQNIIVANPRELTVRGGKLCVAGGPNLVSCGNNQCTEGISMYLFPNTKTDAQR